MRIPLILTAVLLFLSRGVSAQESKEIYLNKCAMCHGPDGAGKTMMGNKLKIVDIRDLVSKRSAEEMTVVVEKGKGTGMSAYSKDFSKEQIKALVTYFRGLAKQ